jgi:hypothetical protein
MNACVAPLYFLLYSTVQYFSPRSTHGASEAFAAASSSVSGRKVSPSRSFAGHQFDWGRVRLDRWVVGCRRVREEDPGSFLEVDTTFAPKKRRISASGFRCESETDSSLKHSSWGRREGRPFPFEDAGPPRDASRYLMCKLSRPRQRQPRTMAAHLVDSSSSALSNSSFLSFFAFAFCFFCAFHSFLELLPCGDEVGDNTGSGSVLAMVVCDSVGLFSS